MNAKFFVPFETAKLLKEKGYPQLESEYHYNINGDMVRFSDDYEGYTEDIIMRIAQDFYAAPIYLEVLDWLIENKIAVITVEMCEILWNMHPIDEAGMRWYCNVRLNDTIVQTDDFDTRWEAINAAILKALEAI